MTGPLPLSLPFSRGPSDPVAIAAVAELAVELVDEVAAVGEDQHAARTRGLDEPERGDRLAGAGRVLEPEPLVGVRVLGALVELDVVVELVAIVLPVLGLLVLDVAVGFVEVVEVFRILVAGDRRGHELDRRRWRRCRRDPVAGAVALGLGEQRGQRARQRVDLVGREHGAVDELRLLLGQQPLEPEQQRVVPAPLDRGLVRSRVQLGQRGVERAPARRPGREGVFERLALVYVAFARE